MKTNNSSTGSQAKTNSESWLESGYGDIERLIECLTAPYVDYDNVALHADELREECWWKLGALMSKGTLERCKTRQQFFGFLKVSFRNHIKSHLGKHLFTSKRTGLEPAAFDALRRGVRRKVIHVRVDDPNITFEPSSSDSEVEMAILLRDFQRVLTPADTETLFELINAGEEANVAPSTTERLRMLFHAFLTAEAEIRPVALKADGNRGFSKVYKCGMRPILRHTGSRQ